ncbi:hypothetical protein L9F63_021368, partial [Diploptera punctata]
FATRSSRYKFRFIFDPPSYICLQQKKIFIFNFSETDVGFFRGEDETVSGDEKWYGVTVLFPSNARRVFPCFDEPSFKSTFQIIVAHSNTMTVLSMMPLQHTEMAERQDWVWDTFAVTSPVSTYAVGIVISQLNSDTPINVPNKNGSLILQFHHKGNHTLPNIQSIKASVQQFIEKMIAYLDAPYPFPKFDFVHLPGMIEVVNPVGLLVARTGYYDGSLHKIEGFVLHYFTQISTPHGWTDFRILNLLSSYLFDTAWWKMQNAELYNKMFSLRQFEKGYLRYMHGLSYSLFGSEWLFSMLNTSLTEDTMRHGLAKVIMPDETKTYTVESIWNALTEQGKSDGTLFGYVNVSTIAKSWLESNCQCFPVMTVTRHYEDNAATVEQHIFFHQIGHETSKEEEETVWWLPFEFLTQQQLDPTVNVVTWFGEKYLNITNLPDSNSFIIANSMGSGYFLVNYDLDNWKLISQYMLTQGSHLAAETRIKLINDAFLLAYGGELSYTVPFNLTLSLYNETNPQIWHSLVRSINYLKKYYSGTPIEDKINSYLRPLFAKIYESRNLVNIKSDSSELQNNEALQMRAIQSLLCYMDYEPCINKMNEKLTKEISSFEIYDNSTESHIACPEFLRSTSTNWLEEFNTFLTFLNNKSYEEKKIYIKNLGKCPEYAPTAERILNDVFHNSFNLTSKDWSKIASVLAESSVSHNICLNFLLQRLDHRNVTSSSLPSTCDLDLLNMLLSKMKTYNYFEKLLEIQEHYGNILNTTSMNRLISSLKEARISATWYNKSGSDINNWIENIPPHFNIRV